MAKILGIQTVNKLLIISTDTNPASGLGTPAPIGSICLTADNSGVFLKTGVLDTGWTLNGGAVLSAYGYAVGQSTATIGANADVVFDLGATPYPNTGFTSVPAPAGHAFVVGITGDYEFDFMVAGVPFSGTSLEFALAVNGVITDVAYEFRSNFSATAGDVLLVVGNGIIHLTAGDSVTLHNRTLSGTNSVSVTSVPLGGEAGANRTLKLKKT